MCEKIIHTSESAVVDAGMEVFEDLSTSIEVCSKAAVSFVVPLGVSLLCP